MTATLIKTSARSPEREKLTAAIARRRQVERDIADRKARIEQLRAREDELAQIFNDTNDALDKSRTDYAESAFVTGVTIRQARQAVEDAEESLAICRGARKAAEDELRELEGVLAVVNINACEVGGVLRSEPAVRRLCEKHQRLSVELEGIRQALDAVRLRGGLPPEHAHILSQCEMGELPLCQAWRVAIAALEGDADAQLPQI